jgi:hypothetical protein
MYNIRLVDSIYTSEFVLASNPLLATTSTLENALKIAGWFRDGRNIPAIYKDNKLHTILPK